MRRFHGFTRVERAAIVMSLLARDGPNCGKCLGFLDQEITCPDHPAFTTIDHIVAIRDGGDVGTVERLDNLRLTHALCNTRRVHYDDRRPSWFAAELQRALRRRADCAWVTEV